MRKIILLGLIFSIMCIGLFAQTQKVAVLSFEKVDKASDYVATSLMKRDMKRIFKDYDKFELINQKEVDKVVKASGYTNIFYLGKEQIAELGTKLNADIVIWGNVQSEDSVSEFKVIAKVWSSQTNDVKQEKFSVSKSSKERIEAFQTNLLDKFEEMSSGEVDKLLGIAMQHFKSKNYSSAEDAFTRIISMEPDKVEAYFYLGYINFKKENPNYEQSEYYYNEGLKRDPTNRDLLDYLSVTYLKQEKYEEAIDALTKIAEADEDKEVYLRIGKIYMDIEEYDNAMDAFDNAIAIDENYGEAYMEAGLLLFDDLEAYERAIPYLEEASKAFPDDDNLSKKLAKCYHKAGRLDSAIEQYIAVIEEQPDNLSAYYNLAGAYRITNQKDKALETLLIIKEKDPENPKVYFRLADSYLAAESYTEAIDAANKALELDEEIYEPHMVLAQIYQATGYTKYEKYLELDEKAKEVYGAEADRIVQQRDQIKADAHADFVKSESNLDKAKEKTNSNSVLKDIERRRTILTKLLDATKKGFF